MALFIALSDSNGDFDFEKAESNVISISKSDTGIGFASTSSIQTVTCEQVSYSQTNTGPTPDRLNLLVNNFGLDSGNSLSYGSPPDIVIFGVSYQYLLPDGTAIVGALTLRPGSFDLGNPLLDHVSIFYDTSLCNGSGYWVVKDGGGQVQLDNAIILYHELAHAFKYVIWGDITDETQASDDENDMRDVEGADHRDINNHTGGCGGGIPTTEDPPPNCIIVSLATGSPYSDEVNSLRNLREHILRRSEVGDDFFKQFFYCYYGFSPEVCRLMRHQPGLRDLIKKYFVAPLLAGLELLIHYAEYQGKGLSDLLNRQAERDEFAEIYQPQFLHELGTYLRLTQNYNKAAISMALLSKGEGFSGIAGMLEHVNDEIIKNDFINWALADVLRTWLSSALLLTTEKTDEETNAEIHALISQWIAHLPITSIWRGFSQLETENELNSLEQFIFDRKSKEIFAERLIDKFPKYSNTILHWSQN
jgi:hypothetical protein